MHIQNQLSVYLHYSKEAEIQYLRLYYKGISNTRFDRRGGNVLKGIIPELLVNNSRTFQGL